MPKGALPNKRNDLKKIDQPKFSTAQTEQCTKATAHTFGKYHIVLFFQQLSQFLVLYLHYRVTCHNFYISLTFFYRSLTDARIITFSFAATAVDEIVGNKKGNKRTVFVYTAPILLRQTFSDADAGAFCGDRCRDNFEFNILDK